MKVKLVTDFGLIPFTISDIKVNHDELKNTGILDSLKVQSNTLTPFAISYRFYGTAYKWENLLDNNGVEPFSFYREDNLEKVVYKPLRNYDLY